VQQREEGWLSLDEAAVAVVVFSLVLAVVVVVHPLKAHSVALCLV